MQPGGLIEEIAMRTLVRMARNRDSRFKLKPSARVLSDVWVQALHRAGQCVFLIALVAGLFLSACATPQRMQPVPSADTTSAMPLGIPNAHFFPTIDLAGLTAEANQALTRRRQVLGLTADAQLPAAYFLAISGGGDNGAFGAGLLTGWAEAGDRPEFDYVTGVSTGALIAPFAFLGPAYNKQLRDVYTTISADDVFKERGFINGIFSDALADTTPLWKLISRYVDEAMMADIAREYQKGRLLVIGTTDLDAERPVLWNIGAIAASGRPGSLDLIRKILRASSAVPAYFPPVLIDVEVDGKSYQEMHVDGGAFAQMFLYPPNMDLRKIVKQERKAYVIWNARQDPEWANAEPRTLRIAGRAISTMIHSSGSNDLMGIYFITQRDGVDYNLAYIGSDFSAPRAGDFDKAYMNALFDYGYQQARRGYSWKKAPPVFAGSQ